MSAYQKLPLTYTQIKSDISDTNGVPVCWHFTHSNYNFNTGAKLNLVETITKNSKPLEVIQDIIGKGKNFWIHTL